MGRDGSLQNKPNAPLGGAVVLRQTNKQHLCGFAVVQQAKQAPMRVVIRKHKHPLVK